MISVRANKTPLWIEPKDLNVNLKTNLQIKTQIRKTSLHTNSSSVLQWNKLRHSFNPVLLLERCTQGIETALPDMLKLPLLLFYKSYKRLANTKALTCFIRIISESTTQKLHRLLLPTPRTAPAAFTKIRGRGKIKLNLSWVSGNGTMIPSDHLHSARELIPLSTDYITNMGTS